MFTGSYSEEVKMINNNTGAVAYAKFAQNTVVYQFKPVKEDGFFWFSKRIIREGDWAKISHSAKASYITLASHTNKDNHEVFPSLETTATMSGLSRKSVVKGITELENLNLVRVIYWTTTRGKRARKYKLNIPSSNVKGRSFPIHRSIVKRGTWRELSRIGKSLYPVMRCYSYFDECEYADLEDDPDFPTIFEGDFFNDGYSSRKYEFCNETNSFLARKAGISRRSIYCAFEGLKDNYLIEPFKGEWKVFIKPQRFYDIHYLNDKIRNPEKYRGQGKVIPFGEFWSPPKSIFFDTR